MRHRSVAAALAGAVLLTACDKAQLTLPDAEDVQSHYEYDGELSVDMSGNVAVITVAQPARQLRRGGALWAKVGPYVFLFSQETEDLFDTYSGLAGVRVITRVRGGPEVARALLVRDELNGLTWRRALHISGIARRDGTHKPALLEALVQWGEDHTEFEYNPRYTSNP